MLTDSSGSLAAMIELGWLEKLDKSAIPNIKNLQPVQQHPSWDPNRDYSLPWQSGMTGIGYDPKLVGGDIKSVDQLLTDPKLKGKVTLLTEMADSVGARDARERRRPDQGHRRHVQEGDRPHAEGGRRRARCASSPATTTRRSLAKGDIYACFAWSGDMVQLQADHPGLKWIIPDSGGDDLDRQHADPEGRQRLRRVGADELVLRPEDRGRASTDYVNYICPVVGADKVLLKTDPAVAKNPLIFPTKAMLANVRQFDPKALNNADYKKQFQHLIGG